MITKAIQDNQTVIIKSSFGDKKIENHALLAFSSNRIFLQCLDNNGTPYNKYKVMEENSIGLNSIHTSDYAPFNWETC